MFNNFLIYYINILLIISAIFTVFSIHPIFSLIFLVLTFMLSAALLLLLNCEFLAFIFLIVYVGGIAVLFLFVIMLLDIKFKNLSKNLTNSNLFGFIFALFFCIVFSENHNVILFYRHYNFVKAFSFINWIDLNNSQNDIEIYSFLLYTNFILQFLLTGFILLLILIGVVFFINSYLILNFKIQNSFRQISLNSKFFYNK